MLQKGLGKQKGEIFYHFLLTKRDRIKDKNPLPSAIDVDD